MKIVHTIWSLETGGSETMLIDILNEQSTTDDIYLVVVNDVVDCDLLADISDRVQCAFVSRPPGSKNPLYILLYNYILLKIKPDIIHCHNDTLNRIIYMKNVIGCKVHLTVHNTNITSDNIACFDKIFSISYAVKNDILNKSGINSIVISNGIRADAIETKKNYCSENFRIVQIGRLYPKDKGQDILLKAISFLIKQHQIQDISVDFIGTGKARKQLSALADELNISEYCTFLGSKTRSYVYSHLKDYDLLIQPSRSEGFGLTVAEGIAAKLPVLVSDVEGPMEIISDGKFGYHFRSEDSNNCADMIYEIIKNYHSDSMMTKVTGGYTHIQEMYSIQMTAHEYIKNYVDNYD